MVVNKFYILSTGEKGIRMKELLTIGKLRDTCNKLKVTHREKMIV